MGSTTSRIRTLEDRIRVLEIALVKVVSFAASAGDTIGMHEALLVIIDIARAALQAPKDGGL